MRTAASSSYRSAFLPAVAFESIKLTSLRSTWITLGIALPVTLILGTMGASQTTKDSSSAEAMSNDVVGFSLASIAFCVLGTLAVTSEYASGTMRTSYLAVPRRPRLLKAKSLVVFMFCMTAGLLASALNFEAATAATTATAPQLSLTDPAVLRAVIGVALYLAVLGVAALSVGLLLQATAGALATMIAATFIIPVVLIPLGNVGKVIAKWWPTEAGRQIMSLTPEPHTLAPLPGFMWFTATTLALLSYAITAANRRDTHG